MKLNDRSAEAAVLPAGKTDHVFWDDALPGFGVRLRGDREHCAKRWLAQYRVGTVQRRESLGDIRKVKIDAARKIARKLFAKAELGVDPAGERIKARSGAITLQTVVNRYLASKRSAWRPASYAAAVHHLNELWRPLHARSIESIKRADIALRLGEIAQHHGRAAAARARTHLSALFAWSVGEGLCEANPCIGTNDPNKGAQSRKRTLSEAELKAVWQACIPDDDFSRIVKLLLFTGCRRDEISALEWSEIDFDTGTLTIRGRRTKNKYDLKLVLSEPALAILRSVPRRGDRIHVFGHRGKGFTGMSHAMRCFQIRMAAAGHTLPHWYLHDIRRSVATHMVDDEIGIEPHIVEAVLNHVGGHKGGVAGIYNRAQYARKIPEALARWSEYLLAVVEGRKRKVVPLRKPA
jgi:integrase